MRFGALLIIWLALAPGLSGASDCPKVLAPDHYRWLWSASGEPIASAPSSRGALARSFGSIEPFHDEAVNQYGHFAAGLVNGPHLLGQYLQTPWTEGVLLEQSRDLAWVLFLRTLFNGAVGIPEYQLTGYFPRMPWLTGHQVGIALHADGAYWALDGARVKQNASELPPWLATMPGKYLEWLRDLYVARRGVDPAVAERMRQISLAALDRTKFILQTSNSFLEHGDPAAPREEWRPQFQAGMTVTLSHHEGELLPLESLNPQYRIPRGKNRFGTPEVIAEIGRFAVEKGAIRELSTREILAGLAAISGYYVRKFYVEVNEQRYRLFRPLGFEVVGQGTNYAGEPEYLLSADPEDVMRKLQGEDFYELYAFKHQKTMLLHILAETLVGGR